MATVAIALKHGNMPPLVKVFQLQYSLIYQLEMSDMDIKAVLSAIHTGDMRMLKESLTGVSSDDKFKALLQACYRRPIGPPTKDQIACFQLLLDCCSPTTSSNVITAYSQVCGPSCSWILERLLDVLALPTTVIEERELFIFYLESVIMDDHRAVEFLLTKLSVIPRELRALCYSHMLVEANFAMAAVVAPDDRINNLNNQGQTLLFLADGFPEYHIINTLINRGADYTVLDSSGRAFFEMLIDSYAEFWDPRLNLSFEDDIARDIYLLYKTAPSVSYAVYNGIPGLLPAFLVPWVLELLQGETLSRDLHLQCSKFYKTRAVPGKEVSQVKYRRLEIPGEK